MGRSHFYFAEKRTFLFGVDMEEVLPCNNCPKCDSLCHSEVYPSVMTTSTLLKKERLHLLYPHTFSRTIWMEEVIEKNASWTKRI